MKQEQRRRGVQVQSVARAAEIIRCFLKEPELGISDIAAEMDLNKSTVFGLVNTLTSYGYLEQVESNKNTGLELRCLSWEIWFSPASTYGARRRRSVRPGCKISRDSTYRHPQRG